MRTGSLTVGPTLQFWEGKFATPLVIKAKTKFCLSQYETNTILPARLVAGSAPPAPTYWRRPAGGTTRWSVTGIIRFPAWHVVCAGNVSIPSISATGVPKLGGRYDVNLTNGAKSSVAVQFCGFSNKTWGALKLPFDLKIVGAAGCRLLASGELLFTARTNTSGVGKRTFLVPNVAAFAGLHVYQQWEVLDRRANSLGLSFSNGGDALHGN